MTRRTMSGAACLTLCAGLATPAAAEFAFDGCEGREDAIRDAYALGFDRAKRAEARIGDDTLYEAWFGERTAAREGIVRANLADIVAHSLIGTPRFTCYARGHPECDEDGDGEDDAYAFVFEGKSFEIHLCDAFWTVEQTTTVDRTDVLIHEISHFHLGASTEDHCYGDTGIGSCVDLAIVQPDLAIENADNYMHSIKDASGAF